MTRHAIKWIRRLSLVLAIIPILIFLAFASAISLIDFNQYKPQIEQEVFELTERKLQIEGDVEVSLFPFGFEVGQFSLSNKPSFAEQELAFLAVKQANIELSFKELVLNKSFQISSLEVIKPTLNLIEVDGQNNWSSLPIFASLSDTPKLTNLTQLAQLANDSSGAFIKVSHPQVDEKELVGKDDVSNESWYLESLVLKDANINYDNRTENFKIALKRASLITFDVRPSLPFKVNSDFVYEHSQSVRSFDIQLNAQMQLEQNLTQVQLHDWNSVFHLKMPKERNLPDLRMGASGEYLMIDTKHQQIYVRNAELNGMNAKVKTSFQGEFGVNPSFAGAFSAEQINIQNWLKHLGLPQPKMQSEKALNDVGGRFLFKLDSESLLLEKVDAKVDESTISGSLNLPLPLFMSNHSKAIQFDLTVNNLNTSDYLAVTDTGESYYPVSSAWLEQVALDGKASFKNVQSASLQATKMDIEVKAKQGVFDLAPLDIEFAEGSLLSKAKVTLTPASTNLTWKGRTNQLAIAELDANIAMQGLLTSRFNLSTKLTNSAQQENDWLENLVGSIQAEITPARIDGVDFDEILSGELRLDKKARSSEFQQISLLGKVAQGKFQPKRFVLDGKQFIASGSGELDLSNNAVQGQLRVNIKQSAENLPRLQGKVLPVQFAGSLHNLQWQLGELSPATAKN